MSTNDCIFKQLKKMKLETCFKFNNKITLKL